MGPSTGMSGPAVTEPPLAHFQAQLHPNDSSLFDDQGYFLDNDFVCELHRQLSIFGWKKSFRFGLYQQAILERLQELGFFVALPVGFNLRLHTPRATSVTVSSTSSQTRDAQPNSTSGTSAALKSQSSWFNSPKSRTSTSSPARPVPSRMMPTSPTLVCGNPELERVEREDPNLHVAKLERVAYSFTERLYALKDIVPPTTRGWISNKVDFGVSAVQNTWYYGSRTVWVVCATALMIGVPLATCWAEDQQIEGMEREYRMRELGGDALLAAGEGKEGSTADQIGLALDRAEAKPAL
ncbi:mitochondrial import receptor subunit TOM-22 [Colletotrichum tofieldiae]|nr:mitochondrial import receptor subunit TOM-22 [Colletotrichum tofieldiae]